MQIKYSVTTQVEVLFNVALNASLQQVCARR